MKLNKLIVLFCLFSFIFAGFNIRYSQSDDSNTFGRNFYSYYGIVDKSIEFGASLDYNKTQSIEMTKLNLSFDYNYDQEFSPFFFEGYESNSFLGNEDFFAGAGLSWWPLRTQLKYPYCWKFSYAMILKGDLINSFRVKHWGYFENYGWKAVSFYKGYSFDFNLTIKYKINRNFSITNHYYFINQGKNSYSSNSLGMEFKL